MSNLTPEQQQAAFCLDRSVCILAGAGCGKTKVLAHHYVALLLEKKLRPAEIVTVTFTEKAAFELQERIRATLLESNGPLSPEEIALLLEEIAHAPLSTIHGLASRILRESGFWDGIDSSFQILAEAEMQWLMHQSLHQTLDEFLQDGSPAFDFLLRHYGWKRLQNQLSEMLEAWPRWKSFCRDLENGEKPSSPFEAQASQALAQLFLKLVARYEDLKTEANLLDFEDLEQKSVQLLQRHPALLRHYQGLWRALLIDEFQDTNPSQDRLFSLLLGVDEDRKFRANLHLAIVGDPKQSIYRFRGASPEIFEKYQALIEQNGGVSIALTRNFRSPASILSVVNECFQGIWEGYAPLQAFSSRDFPVRTEDSLRSIEILASPLELGSCSAEMRRRLEAQEIAKVISAHLEEGILPEEIFLLFRSSSAMPLYQEIFEKSQIPTFVKSSSLWERQEILDLLHAMKGMLNPEDLSSWIGLYRSPAVGLSDEELLDWALREEKDNRPARLIALHPLAKQILALDPAISPYRFTRWFLEKTGLVELYAKDPVLETKAHNLLQFLNFAWEWERQRKGDLKEFVEEIERRRAERMFYPSLSDALGGGSAVTLMTIHQSKGLDLPVVILPDLEASGRPDVIPMAALYSNKIGWKIPVDARGIEPQFKNSERLQNLIDEKKQEELEEENRVFYVATTRSVKKLILGFLPRAEKVKRSACWQKKLAQSEFKNARGPQKPSKNSGQELKAEAQDLRKEAQSDRFEKFAGIFPPPLKTHFSVTELECFSSAPDEYRARYLYRLPLLQPYRPQSPFRLDAIERGNLIHRLLCRIARESWTEDLQKNSPRFQESLKSQISALLSFHPFETEAEKKEELEKIRQIIETTLFFPSFQGILFAEEGYSEIPFLLSFPPYEIQGAIDRLIRVGEQWKIIDYKTHQSDSASERSKLAPSFEFQLKTYCLAASRKLQKPVLQASIYFVMWNEEYPFSFSPEELLRHEKNLFSQMEAMQEIASSLSAPMKSGESLSAGINSYCSTPKPRASSP